jgi:hypothetical protein
MKDRISETKKTPSNITKFKDYMRTCFSCTSAQETRKDDGQDLARKIQEIQKREKEQKVIKAEIDSKLANVQDMNNQEKDKISKLVNEGLLTSDNLLSLYQQSKKEVKLLIDAGVRHDDIELIDGKIALKGKTTEISSRDRSKDKQILAEFRSANKGRSITDTLAQAKKDQEVLDSLTDITVHYLEKALKLSPTDRLQFGKDVKDIYTHHDVRVSDAHTLYQYYDLQRRKDELKKMAIGKDKLCKQAYNILSLNARQNRRYKIRLTESLEAYEERREHLVDKYGNSELEKRGKHGKEKRRLDDLIKAKKELLESVLTHKLFNSVMEKLEKDKINTIYKDDNDKKYAKILKLSRETSQDIHAHIQYCQTKYITEKNRIYLEHLIKKHGSGPVRSWLNDVASDGGAVLTVGGSIVTGLTLGGIVS